MIPVVSFVASSGTGKTTLLETLIPLLNGRGLRVGVLKHDAHDFEVDTPGKDSWRLTRAGAAVTVIASATHAAVMENRPRSPEELLAAIRDVDLILTEGYKHGPWPKIGLLRAGKPLPIPREACLAVVTDRPEAEPGRAFSYQEPEALAEFLTDWLRRQPVPGEE